VDLQVITRDDTMKLLNSDMLPYFAHMDGVSTTMDPVEHNWLNLNNAEYFDSAYHNAV